MKLLVSRDELKEAVAGLGAFTGTGSEAPDGKAARPTTPAAVSAAIADALARSSSSKPDPRDTAGMAPS